MTSSLVGSEMCIRDRLLLCVAREGERSPRRGPQRTSSYAYGDQRCPQPVSYTHLTLPTICSV
eukprot:5612874-Prorocentrum_lima.AAC.1